MRRNGRSQRHIDRVFANLHHRELQVLADSNDGHKCLMSRESVEKRRAAVVRVQLDLPAQRIDEINRIMARTGMTTRKEFFDNALTLFEWAVNERARGKIIGAISPDESSYKELVMPTLACVHHEKDQAKKA
jgi:hypothetical protein